MVDHNLTIYLVKLNFLFLLRRVEFQ